MGTDAITDAIKALARSLHASTILPAGLFVLINFRFVLPHISKDVFKDADFASLGWVIALSSATLMFSYMLYAYNYCLIRLFEGYTFMNSKILKQIPFIQWLYGRKLKRYEELKDEIDQLQKRRLELVNELEFHPDEVDLRTINTDKLGQGVKKTLEKYFEISSDLLNKEHHFDTRFPSSRDSVLPTELGNVMAAFEEYPRTRYGMSSIVLWPRLVPVLKKQQYMEFVSQEKAVFDFLMNICVVTCIAGFELWFVLLPEKTVTSTALLPISLFIAYLLYKGMVYAACQWGTMVRVAFDLHRRHLYEDLQLRMAESPEDEYRRWKLISEFFISQYGRELENFTEFEPQSRFRHKEHKE